MMLIWKGVVERMHEVNKRFANPEEGWTVFVVKLDDFNGCILRYTKKYGWNPIKYIER